MSLPFIGPALSAGGGRGYVEALLLDIEDTLDLFFDQLSLDMDIARDCFLERWSSLLNVA